MPRNVRNFWIELDVDGKRERIAAGPRAKDGGFSLTVKVRHLGEVLDALEIEGMAHSDGSLTLRAVPLYDESTPAIRLSARR